MGRVQFPLLFMIDISAFIYITTVCHYVGKICSTMDCVILLFGGGEMYRESEESSRNPGEVR